ncbi:MAG: PDZ domain-containing protein [Burkholderiales bacterium]
MLRNLCAIACAALVSAACAGAGTHDRARDPAASAVAGVPFAGMWLEDAEQGGAVVTGTVAGPAAIAGLTQGDRIVSVDGGDADSKRLRALVRAARPGQLLRLEVMRGDTPMQIRLTIDAHHRWAGPAAYPAAVPFDATGLAGLADQRDYAIEQALAGAPQVEPIDRRLDRMFAGIARDDTGYHKLPLIRTALMQPGAMTAWREDLVRHARPTDRDRPDVTGLICETLALACPQRLPTPRAGPDSLAQFAEVIGAAKQGVRDLLRSAGIDREQAIADLLYLMQTTAADRTLLKQPDAQRGIRAMQQSMQVDIAALLAVADNILANILRLPPLAGTPREPPAVLAGAVAGEILDFHEIDGGFIVIGGPGPNRYDMDRLHAVIDVGGDDIYRWGDSIPLPVQAVIDLAGDDRYQALRGGPGAGWLGVSVLIDLAGDDHYGSTVGGCGAGALGFGFLFDDDGADNYRCAAWSMGAGLYGSGMLIDGGTHIDVYLSEVFSQGVGGPRGLGVLVDGGGDDLYRADGAVPSVYGTPGAYMAFSQGVGVGIRPYDTGGVGALLDFAGDDRYQGGEFSQGGGYFWGAGLLYDEDGDDLYFGNRYAQGFAAHQAFGMLADMAGDDIYWSMTAAGQGAAWDQSIAVLFDGAGDDVYRAQTLSQGAAAQQARASLHDAAGDDRYWSSSDIAQGAAGDNSYHYVDEDPVYSLGVLLDGGGSDRYSTGLRDGEVRLRLEAGNAEPGRGVAGIAVDRERAR